MHTIELLINTTKFDRKELSTRFFMLAHVHNVCVKHARKLLNSLKTNKQYQDALKEYRELKESKPKTKEEKENTKKRKKELSTIMSDIRKEIGLTEYGLQSYLKICGKQFNKRLASTQIQKEATSVWKGVNKILTGNGKTLHYKKVRDFDTLPSKNMKNGIKFNKDTFEIEYLGLEMKCKISKYDLEDLYIWESLENKISYCEIKRRMFNNGWHYYALVYVDGNPPIRNIESKGSTMGLDPGVSTIAGCSETSVALFELAPKCKDYNKKINKILQQMERSKRQSNPNKYNEDGTIKKGNKDKWVFSNRYYKLRNELKTLYRKKSEYTTHSHRTKINELLKDSLYYIIEEMNFNALKKRGKVKDSESNNDDNKNLTTTQDKKQIINESINNESIQNTENECETPKKKPAKTRKRFGKTINDRSPASFLRLFEEKVKLMGGMIVYISPIIYKGSQYNHDTDTYEKVPLNQREKIISGKKVQRDLYSAFLYHNADVKFEHTDRDKCIAEFENFVKMQDELIAKMKSENISYKNCFGF